MSNNFKVAPLSRSQIETYVKIFRKKLGITTRTPICQIFEQALSKFFPNFEWEILPKNEMTEEGVTVNDKKIYIREDVYEKAYNGNGRARFTIAHEIGHFLLHTLNNIKLCRLAPNEKLKPYEDPEYQANAFASALLMGEEYIKGKDYIQVAKECSVSYSAAKIRIDFLKKN